MVFTGDIDSDDDVFDYLEEEHVRSQYKIEWHVYEDDTGSLALIKDIQDAGKDADIEDRGERLKIAFVQFISLDNVVEIEEQLEKLDILPEGGLGTPEAQESIFIYDPWIVVGPKWGSLASHLKEPTEGDE